MLAFKNHLIDIVLTSRWTDTSPTGDPLPGKRRACLSCEVGGSVSWFGGRRHLSTEGVAPLKRHWLCAQWSSETGRHGSEHGFTRRGWARPRDETQVIDRVRSQRQKDGQTLPNSRSRWFACYVPEIWNVYNLMRSSVCLRGFLVLFARCFLAQELKTIFCDHK